ncbi:MAG: hypothetical protein R3C59_28855 [Planctomycetaceae bacterium]
MSRALVVLLLVGTSCADEVRRETSRETQSSPVGDRQELILSGFLSNGSTLRQGVYEAKGDVKHFDAAGNVTFEGTVSIFSAFDFDAETFRFDRSETALDEVVREEGAETLIETHEIQTGGKMISLPDRSVIWLRNPEGRPIITGAPTLQNEVVRPVDPRCYGLGSQGEVERHTWAQAGEMLRRPATEVIDGEDGQVTLAWQFRAGSESAPRGPTIRRELVFDTANGYRPVHFHTANGLNKDGTWRRITDVVDVRWAEREGAWIPESVTIEKKSRSDSQLIKMDFNWTSVNNAAETEGYFDPLAFELPKKVNHIDVRLGGTPISLGPPGTAPPPISVVPAPRTNTQILILVNIVVVLALLFAWLYHSKKA